MKSHADRERELVEFIEEHVADVLRECPAGKNHGGDDWGRECRDPACARALSLLDTAERLRTLSQADRVRRKSDALLDEIAKAPHATDAIVSRVLSQSEEREGLAAALSEIRRRGCTRNGTTCLQRSFDIDHRCPGCIATAALEAA